VLLAALVVGMHTLDYLVVQVVVALDAVGVVYGYMYSPWNSADGFACSP